MLRRNPRACALEVYRAPASLLMALAITSCGGHAGAPTGPREPPRALTANERTITNANTGFGLRLLREVNSQEARPNVVISPLSASMALGMTMNGAADSTLDAMRRTLDFSGLSDAEVNSAYRSLSELLLGTDPKVEFALANSLWHERSFTMKAPFVDAVRQSFDAEVTALDFADPAAPRTISRWAEEKTNGRIKDLIDEIGDEVIFLVNAVYFKAPWSAEFDARDTRPGSFRRLNGTDVTVPLMSRTGQYRTFMSAEIHAAELMYGDSAFSMTLLMPANQNTSLQTLAQSLTSERWNALFPQFTTGRVMIVMPKFRLEYDIELKEALEQLGMAIAFDPSRANFTGMSTRADLHISRVTQKAFIEVDEVGTRAAAATSVGVQPTSGPPQLMFNRPFLFAIRERSSGALLFVGRVGDPSGS